MTHAQLVRLIEKGVVRNSGGVWADFGSGDGAFTLALRECLGSTAQMFSIDKDNLRLDGQAYTFTQTFPETNITYLHKDFTTPLHLPPLDGLLVANAIHFQKDTLGTLKKLAHYLKPGGTFLLVEYSADKGNMYVPFPFRYETFAQLAPSAGLTDVSLLATIPSTMLDEIYAAKAIKG